MAKTLCDLGTAGCGATQSGGLLNYRIDDLADQLGLPAAALSNTIDNFNDACPENLHAFHPTTLDGLSTTSIEPAKTNWARPVCDPPYYAYSLRPGVTFTYLGLKVEGSILGQGYLAGFGMTIGTVFGRIAGREAAHYINANKAINDE